MLFVELDNSAASQCQSGPARQDVGNRYGTERWGFSQHDFSFEWARKFKEGSCI